MTDIFKLVKQAASMRKEVKQIQQELAGKTMEGSSAGGKIRAKVRGDLLVENVYIDPSMINPEKQKLLEEAVAMAVNAALQTAKNTAAKEISKLGAGMGLGGLSDLL